MQEFYQQLENASLTISKRSKNLPEGYLGTKTKGKHQEYYWHNHPYPSPKGERYLKKSSPKEMSQAKRLAEKSYYASLERVIAQQKKLLQSCMEKLKPEALANCYEQLSPGKKLLVDPIFYPDELYAQKWQQMEYTRFIDNYSSKEFISPRNEVLRSKSEMLLTKLFCEYDIPYHYEYPLVCNNGVTYRPDFFLLNKRTRKEYFWEHFGLMDNEEYRTKNLNKLEIYAQNGIILGKNLILSFESQQVQYNEAYMKQMIHQYLL